MTTFNNSEEKIPEILLYKTLKALFELLNDDLINASSDQDTILYSIFSDMDLEGTNLFNTAKNLVLKDESKPDKLTYSLGYSLERKGAPTIHILLPSEQPIASPIGGNEGYQDDVQIDNENGEYRPTYTNDSRVSYNLLITSKNTLEVIILYNILKMGFLSIH